MQIISGKKAMIMVSNLIYEKKQVHEDSIDLTVKAIFQIMTTGAVDFGGSEFEESRKDRLDSKRANKDDEFGWWNLDPGDYLVQYNEEIACPTNILGLIQPLDRIVQNGTTHSALLITGTNKEIYVLLRVGERGIKIKQNARISTLICFE